MVSMERIEELGRAIGREFRPQRVILFGSYAYGTSTEDSDVDLLVVMPHTGKAWRVASQIRARVRPRFPVDLVVRAPEQVRKRIALGDCFMKEITERGRVLYESADG